ncbi:hypothetical protein B0H11DRAFT_2258699 [Mycena galericulata]|nr:hypothetical protein B0H11DRAFT_2258699 [Mycena galericulata]
MAPKPWGSDEQVTWLQSYVGKYIKSKSDGDQISFFMRIDAEWLRLWPEEAVLGLPRDDSDVSLTSDQSALLGRALEKRKQQLRTWFRNHVSTSRKSGATTVKKDDMTSISAALWKDKRRHRDPQLVELYQTLYPERVTAGLKDANFEAIHKGDVDWVGMEGEEPAPALKATIKQQASARLSARRAVSQKLFEAETDEVKTKVKLELERVKKAKLENKTEDVELTPELAQLSIDQLEGIIDRLHSLIMEKTGWVGFTMLGGPTPRAGGALGVVVYSCGTSPNGNTFKDSHPDWNEGVSSIFVEFLRRRFPRALRDAMALPDPVDSVKMDCEDDQDDGEEPPAKSKPKKQKDKPEFKAPKRSKGTTAVASTVAVAASVAAAAITLSSATPLSSPTPPSPPSPPLNSAAVLDLHQTMESESTYDISQTAVNSTYGLSQTSTDSMDDTSQTTANTTYDLSFWARHPGYDSGGPVYSYTEGQGFDSGANDMQPTEGQGMDLSSWSVEEDLNLNDFDQFMATVPEYFAPQPPAFFAAPDLSSVHTEDGEIGAVPSGERALTATPRSPAPTPPTCPSLPATPVGQATEVNRAPPKPPMATLSTEAAASTAVRHPSPPNMLLPSTVVSRPSPPNTSPLPPRIARTSSAAAAARGDVVAIVASSAALEAAMEARRKLQEEDTENSSEDEEPLAGPQYPISRPMANPPKPYLAAKVGGSDSEAGGRRAQGGRGQGRGRGRGHGRGKGKGKGRGGRGGGGGGGGRQGAEVFEGETSGAGEGEDEDSGVVDAGEVGGCGRGQRAPLAFLQTYGDNGEVILLPLDTPDPAMNTQRWREIRVMERERDRKANAAPKADLLRNPAGGSDLVVLPRLPGAPMPPVPQLGRPGRERRAPKNPNETDEALLQRLEKSKEMLKEKSKGQAKRKGHEENEGPQQKRARTC